MCLFFVVRCFRGLLVVGCWCRMSFVVRWLRFVVCSLLFVFWCKLLHCLLCVGVCCLLFGVCCLLLGALCLLFVGCSSTVFIVVCRLLSLLLVVCCALFVGSYV